MTVKEGYKKRYKSGDTPWDIGRPDFNLIEVVSQRPVSSCKALDIGCGTGDNSIWLAQNNFKVTGTDTSEDAIEKATEKSLKAGVECHFMLVDFLENQIKGAPFGFIFDRGCFHSFNSEIDRKKFAENVAAHLGESGLWLTIVGNADEHRQGPGPPQRTATDIVLAVESYFEILLLESSLFGSNSPTPPRAWRCLMQRRKP
ncbi:MAG: class I SAM-dependent methyltransferase [Desulfobacteraceae bacterium]|nr:class I SAM-dependent methyltransferase [Desulfobacteraceae bacterium]